MSIPKILNFPCSRDEPLKSVHFHHRFTHCWHSQTDLSPLPSLQVLSGRQSLHHHISSTSFYYAPSICLAPKPGNIKGCSKRPENYFIFFFHFLAMRGLCRYSWAFSSCSEKVLPSGCEERVSHCSGFSSCWAQALRCAGFSEGSVWAQWLWLVGSRVLAQ